MQLSATRHQVIAATSLIGLIALCVAWELWLAPLRPGGSWLVLKCLPLLLPLMGILRGKRYTYQWASLFIWFYVAEGATRAFTDASPAHWLALVECVLGFVFFFAAAGFARATRPSLAHPQTKDSSAP